MATALKSKPGLTGATALSIPAAWDATWFRHFIHNMLKGADVRNAVGAGGVTVTGNISSPYATIGFNGSTGLVITDGTHTVNGVTSIQFSGAVVSGVSPNGVVTISASGLVITDGTHTVNGVTSIQFSGAVVSGVSPNGVVTISASGGVTSVTGTTNEIVATPTTGAVVLSFAPNVVIPAPASGATLTIDGVAAGDPHVLILAGDTSGSTRSFDIVRSGAYNIFNVFNDGSFTFGGAGGTTLSGSAAGNITIAAPGSGIALTVTGINSANSMLVQSGLTASDAFGLQINAGSNSIDYALLINDAADTVNHFRVSGDGGVVVGAPTGGSEGAGTVNATGYYLNGVLLATPTTGTSSQSATGFAATVPTVTLAYTIVGKSVTLYIPAISGTSNSAGFGINIPAAITPATTKNTAVPLYGWTNGGSAVNIVGAGAQVGSGGSIAFFITGGSSWTASGTKASPAMSITYDLT